MPGGSTVKRVRVRLKATDRESLARVFATQLGRDRVFLRGCAPIPPGTAVMLEIGYADRTVALRGRGVVAWVERSTTDPGVEFSIAWDESSTALVSWIIENAAQFTPHPELSPEIDESALAPPILPPLPPLTTPLGASSIGPSLVGAPPVREGASQLPASLAADLVSDLGLPPPSSSRASPGPALPSPPRPAAPPAPPPPRAEKLDALYAALPTPTSPSLFAVTGEIVAAFDANFLLDEPDEASDEAIDADGFAVVPVEDDEPLDHLDAEREATNEALEEEPVDLDDLVAAVEEPIDPHAPGPLAELDQLRETRAPSITEYARYTGGGMRDDLELAQQLVEHHTDEVIPRIPAPTQWTDEHKTEWDRQSGEVTPLARIELVRKTPSDVTPVEELAAIEAQMAAMDDRFPDAVPAKSGQRWLPPKGDVVIGIDLGTTYTCAAVVEDGQARVIPSRRGTNTIPSVVLIHANGKTIVGEPAQRKQPLFPSNTIVAVKRLIGRPYHSPVVQRAKKRATYEIVEGDEGEAAVRIEEHKISLEEISALILKEIRESASLTLHRKVNRAVITCPAYYNERQREAVRTAGELAGFHVERVLPEPTAAALSYGLGRGFAHRRMLVYDLGGGTFDASLLEVDGNVFGVLATGGDTFLGGLDFDACIVEQLVSHLKSHHKLDPREDATAMGYLFQLAEQAKRDLSEQSSVHVKMQHFVAHGSKPVSFDVVLERAQLEAQFDPLVRRSLEVAARVCGRAKVSLSSIDDVILVGGQSRSPIVRNRLRELFGKEPRRDLHPDEVVAMGAARYAASLEAFDGLVLVDTLPISIGIGLAGGRFKRIIAQDTSLPATRVHRMETSADDQTQLELVVLQGEEEQAAENELIGVLVIKGLPKAPAGNIAVLVTFALDAECFLELTVVEERSGLPVETEFLRRGTPEEILGRLGPADLRAALSPTNDSGPQPVPDTSGSGGLLSWIRRTLTPGR